MGDLFATGAIETWLECSSLLTLDELVVMGDGLLRRRHPLATWDELSFAVASRRSMRGSIKLQAALLLLRSGTDSARETMLRLVLERAGLPEPEVNGCILDERGMVIAHGDLVYREYRVIIEYDGGHHRTDEWQFSVDIQRIDRLIELGWRVLRVDKRLLANSLLLIAKAQTALRQRGWADNMN